MSYGRTSPASIYVRLCHYASRERRYGKTGEQARCHNRDSLCNLIIHEETISEFYDNLAWSHS